jgi:hypothetical protein
MMQKLDLNDLEIDAFDTSLNEYTEGHGLSEIGASSQTGTNSCGQGSCKTSSEPDGSIIFNQ